MSYFASTKPITEAGKVAASGSEQGAVDLNQLMNLLKRQSAPYQAYGAPALKTMGDLLGIKTPQAVQQAIDSPQKTYQQTNVGGWELAPDVDPVVFKPMYDNFSNWYKQKYKRDFTLSGMEGKYTGDFKRKMQELEGEARNVTG